MAGTEVRVNEAGDILCLRLLSASSALSREFGDLRCTDCDGEGRPAGVELIGLPGGMSLRGLPEAARVREDLRAHGPPALRIEGDRVFHPARKTAAATPAAAARRRTPATPDWRLRGTGRPRGWHWACSA